MQWRWTMVLASVVAHMMVSGALAQTGPARSGVTMGPRGGTPTARPDEEKVAQQNLAEVVALRMSQLEEDLRLQPQQAPAWSKYRDSVQRLLDDRRRFVRTMAAESTAPKRLDALADGARNRLTAVEDVVDAGKALYAVLTADQRVVADRRLALPLAALTTQEVSRASR